MRFSCEYQILSVVHDIYASFDCNPPKDVKEIFLDISKSFDRVWHEGLIYKMTCIAINGIPLKCLQNFLQNRHQRVLLIGQCSSCAPVFAGVPQRSVLDPLFLVIYINDLTKAISSTNKLFPDDTSIFSIVNDIDVSEHELNSEIFMWAYQWKMSFNPDVSKQAQEVIFSNKTQNLSRPAVLFHNPPVQRSTVQKYFGIYLDEKVNFNTHITGKICKAIQGVGVIRKLFKSLPRNALLTIHKLFVRPHLDYGDIVYDRPNNESFISKL